MYDNRVMGQGEDSPDLAGVWGATLRAAADEGAMQGALLGLQLLALGPLLSKNGRWWRGRGQVRGFMNPKLYPVDVGNLGKFGESF